MKLTERQIRRIVSDEIKYQNTKHAVLSEGLMDVLGKLGGGVVENIKEGIAKKIMDLMGVDTDSIIAEVFINFFGNLEISDVKDMLTGDNKCLTGTGQLAGAITETIVEKIPELLGIDTSGVFAGAMREGMSKALTQDFNNKLAESLCDIDYGPVLKDIPGGDMISKFLS